jgi:hypothetical protein
MAHTARGFGMTRYTCLPHHIKATFLSTCYEAKHAVPCRNISKFQPYYDLIWIFERFFVDDFFVN